VKRDKSIGYGFAKTVQQVTHAYWEAGVVLPTRMMPAHDIKYVLAYLQVLICQHMTAEYGQFAQRNSADVILNHFFILGKSGPSIADGRDTQSYHKMCAPCGISHEIAMQSPISISNAQGFVWQGEVIHADLQVACLDEQLFPDFVQFTLLLV